MSSETVEAARDIVQLDRWKSVSEAWKCPHLTVNTARPGDEFLRGGTMVRLDGDEHRKRRRIVGQLLSRGGHKYFRDKFLHPTVESALTETLANRDADGRVRFEAGLWARRINQQLAAGLVGFDAAATPEGADALFGLVAETFVGYQSVFDNAFQLDFDADGPDQQRSRTARATIVEKYYEPALARRRELLAKVESGELSKDDLPQDYLMLVAQGLDPAWIDDVDLPKREAVFLLTSGVHTTSFMTVWTLRELFEYLKTHPQDEQYLLDDDFLLGAANEALRLHPVTKGFVRLAEADVEVGDGVKIADGSLVVLKNGPAATDESVYGADAQEFDPRRVDPQGASANSLAFGAGPHMCFGMPIVMGREGMDGSLLFLVKSVLETGARPDPDKAPTPVDAVAARGVNDITHAQLPLILPD